MILNTNYRQGNCIDLCGGCCFRNGCWQSSCDCGCNRCNQILPFFNGSYNQFNEFAQPFTNGFGTINNFDNFAFDNFNQFGGCANETFGCGCHRTCNCRRGNTFFPTLLLAGCLLGRNCCR